MAIVTHIVKVDENEIEKAVQVRAADPGAPVSNQLWINSTDKKLKFYDGATAQTILSDATNQQVVSKTAAYTIQGTDGVILCDDTAASFTVTLPTAVGAAGKQYTIKKINSSSNIVTIATNASETIDALSSYELSAKDAVIVLVSDNANWKVTSYPEVLINSESIVEGFNNFVKPVYIAAPITAITNRGVILDDSNTLKSLMPVEYIPCVGLDRVYKENSAAGAVYKLQNSDSRVRLAGPWFSLSDVNGSRLKINPNETSSFVEVVFYGTGLNIGRFQDSTQTDIRATIDGGAEGANLAPANPSNTVTQGVNQNANVRLNIVKGLSLGWHTVKIRQASAAIAFELSSIEIINEATLSNVLAGKGYYGLDIGESLAASTLPFKPTAMTGTKGGKVINYFDTTDSTSKQAYTEVPATSSYLTSSSHANEKVSNRINWREFGKNRTKDFSVLTSSAAGGSAFHMDDQTTMLSAKNAFTNTISGEQVLLVTGLGHITLTFVGTGLDIIRIDNANGGADINELFVDGVSQGNFSTTGSVNSRIEKVCSGLPYGSHTVKIVQNGAATFNLGITDFVIYEPALPSIPATAIKLQEYNLVADHVLKSADLFGNVSTGVIRKSTVVGPSFQNTWNGSYIIDIDISSVTVHSSGFNPLTSFDGSFEYTFIGTGFVFTTGSDTNARTAVMTLDGSTDFSVHTNSFVNNGSNFTWTPSTGVLDCPSGGGAAHDVLTVTGLPYGLHTIKGTKTTGAGGFNLRNFDVITPIHQNSKDHDKPNISSNDLRVFSPIKEDVKPISDIGEAKALLKYNMVTNKISHNKNIAGVIDVSAGVSIVYFKKPFKNKNYIATATTSEDIASFVAISEQKTGSLKINIRHYSGTTPDMEFYLSCFGELID